MFFHGMRVFLLQCVIISSVPTSSIDIPFKYCEPLNRIYHSTHLVT
jgi:hypothetical protein